MFVCFSFFVYWYVIFILIACFLFIDLRLFLCYFISDFFVCIYVVLFSHLSNFGHNFLFTLKFYYEFPHFFHLSSSLNVKVSVGRPELSFYIIRIQRLLFKTLFVVFCLLRKTCYLYFFCQFPSGHSTRSA